MKKSTHKSSKKTLIYMLAFVLMLGSFTGILFGCQKTNPNTPTPIVYESFANDMPTSTKVGYSAKYLGTVSRQHPEEKAGDFEEKYGVSYPTYGVNSTEYTEEIKRGLIAENGQLLARSEKNQGGSYDSMNKNGELFLNNQPVLNEDGTQRKLYKHVGANGLYYGDVSAKEPAIKKQITQRRRDNSISYEVTGLYAPAGEVITVEVSKEEMEREGKVSIHIGQALFNGQANNIWDKKNFCRMPVILNTMELTAANCTLNGDKYIGYVGSFLGGPIYVRTPSKGEYLTTTITGGVRYSHFILGYTTKEEFEENAKSSAPYFDLEVWENGVLHSGPKKYAEGFSYEDLYKAAIYWDKVALVSTKITTQGIVFIYDPFVAAGAAVAFPGRCSLNCPASWMTASLNYVGLVTNGAWGNMHEYNHNFQGGWGKEGGTEVTNNAVTLVEYSVFTKISSMRQIKNYGAEGLDGWNRYTSASWVMNQVLNGRENDLSVYAAILHSFGPDTFIKIINYQQAHKWAQNQTNWARAISEVTHQNMTYFYNNLVSGYSVNDSWKSEVENYEDWPTFIPIASAYQTGRSYEYDGHKQYIKTARPYQIKAGEDFLIDLRKYDAPGGFYNEGSVVLPAGFTYEIEKITQPSNGMISKVKKTEIQQDVNDPSKEVTTEVPVENVYNYHPAHEGESGEIYVTLKIIPPEQSNLQPSKVDLILEFESSHELNKSTLERTIYTFDEAEKDNEVNTDARKAFESGYAGVNQSLTKKIDNINTTQNSNTDIWFTDSEIEKNQIFEVSGKLYADEIGKYRIQIRGRYNVAVFYKTDPEQDYQFGAQYIQTSGDYNFPSLSQTGTYFDITTTKAGTWIYFKEVMIGCKQAGKKLSFVGLGMGEFTPPAPIIDPKTGELTGEEIPESVVVKYAQGYRNSYEMPKTGYETDYFYKKLYSYSYEGLTEYGASKQVLQEGTTYEATSDANDKYNVNHIVDGDLKSEIHSNKKLGTNNPSISFVIDLKEMAELNKLVIYLRHKDVWPLSKEFDTKGNPNIGRPIDLTLEVSDDNITYREVGDFKDIEYQANSRVEEVTFDSTTFRYAKIMVTRTDNAWVAFAELKFYHDDHIKLIDGNQLSPDNSTLNYLGNWKLERVQSSFGHVYEGKKGAKLKFEFVGQRFGILSSNYLDNKFKVIIDGKEISSIKIKEQNGTIITSYISNLLEEGKHVVEIECASNANIDSIVIWK